MAEDKGNLKSELQRMADEIRVRLHLAGMEAKDAWAKVEPRLREFEQKIEGAAGKMTDELSAIGTQLRGEVGRIRDRIAAATQRSKEDE